MSKILFFMSKIFFLLLKIFFICLKNIFRLCQNVFQSVPNYIRTYPKPSSNICQTIFQPPSKHLPIWKISSSKNRTILEKRLNSIVLITILNEKKKLVQKISTFGRCLEDGSSTFGRCLEVGFVYVRS